MKTFEKKLVFNTLNDFKYIFTPVYNGGNDTPQTVKTLLFFFFIL